MISSFAVPERKCCSFYSCTTKEIDDEIRIRASLGYYMRGNKRLLMATLTAPVLQRVSRGFAFPQRRCRPLSLGLQIPHRRGPASTRTHRYYDTNGIRQRVCVGSTHRLRPCCALFDCFLIRGLGLSSNRKNTSQAQAYLGYFW